MKIKIAAFASMLTLCTSTVFANNESNKSSYLKAGLEIIDMVNTGKFDAIA
jgi:hypothetical protein